MRGSWFVVALASSALSGCSEWPRSGNLGDAPTYASPDEDVTASVQWGNAIPESANEADEWKEEPFAANLAEGAGPGIAKLFAGTIDGGGWSKSSPIQNCGAVEGFYAGDADAPMRFEVSARSYFCLSALLDTTEHVGWDLTLVEVTETECKGPVKDAEGTPFGIGVTRLDEAWGANVEPGTYAVVIGAYQPATTELLVPYTLGVSIWAPFEGSAEQCPLLEVAP